MNPTPQGQAQLSTVAARSVQTNVELAHDFAARVSGIALYSQLYDARVQTLQKIPAPICHADLVPPFPYPTHPLVPIPGDPGAFSSAIELEDR